MIKKLFNFKRREVNFDKASFTNIDSQVAKKITEVIKAQQKGEYGNPVSTHSSGEKAQKLIIESKKKIGTILGVKEENIFFTDSATQSNKIAFETVLRKFIKNKNITSKNIIISDKEHSSIYNTAQFFKDLGIELRIIKTKNGIVTIDELKKNIDSNTVFISIQYVNSRTGIKQDIKNLARESKLLNNKIIFHTDASQAINYFDCGLGSLSVDAISFGATKIHGPQGVGVLAFLNLEKILHKDIKRWDVKSGTPSVALIVGVSVALEKVVKNKKNKKQKTRENQIYLLEELKKNIKNVYIEAIEKSIEKITSKDLEKISPHILAVNFGEINHEYLSCLLNSCGFLVSVDSSCKRYTNSRNSNNNDFGIIRISIDSKTTKSDIKNLVLCIKKSLKICNSGGGRSLE